MPRKIDLNRMRRDALAEIDEAGNRYNRMAEKLAENRDLADRRWLACVTLADMYAAWERFAERRLVVALNHNPHHFFADNSVRGAPGVPIGLADYVVRGGRKYFDFRSCDDLLRKADMLVSKKKNPFQAITRANQNHLDVAAAIRNFIAHGSDAARDAYKGQLKKHFKIKSAPQPGEFLDSIDRRTESPNHGAKRIYVFERVLADVITST